jgi:hypothetical protein
MFYLLTMSTPDGKQTTERTGRRRRTGPSLRPAATTLTRTVMMKAFLSNKTWQVRCFIRYTVVFDDERADILYIKGKDS